MPLLGLEPFDTATRRGALERAEKLAAKPRLVASRFDPPLGGIMSPGSVWRSRFSGLGRLPAHHYLRVVLGRFNVVTEQLYSYYLCLRRAFQLK